MGSNKKHMTDIQDTDFYKAIKPCLEKAFEIHGPDFSEFSWFAKNRVKAFKKRKAKLKNSL